MITQDIYWLGVRHLLSPYSVSKYELTNIINNVYNLGIKINKKVTGNWCDRTLSTTYQTNTLFKIPDIKKQIHVQALYIL